MAFSAITPRGSNVSNASSSTLTVNPTANLVVGKIIFVTCTSDNAQTTDGDSTLHSVSDTQGHTWNKVFEKTETDGAAGDGCSHSLWWTKVTTQIDTGNTITLTLGSAQVDKIISIVEATVAAGNSVQVAGSSITPHAGSTVLAAEVTGLTNKEYLFFGSFGAEGEDTTKTPIANYTEQFDLVSSTSGAAAANVQQHIQTRILTATTDIVQSTVDFTSGLQALIAFEEITPTSPILSAILSLTTGASVLKGRTTKTSQLVSYTFQASTLGSKVQGTSIIIGYTVEQTSISGKILNNANFTSIAGFESLLTEAVDTTRETNSLGYSSLEALLQGITTLTTPILGISQSSPLLQGKYQVTSSILGLAIRQGVIKGVTTLTSEFLVYTFSTDTIQARTLLVSGTSGVSSLFGIGIGRTLLNANLLSNTKVGSSIRGLTTLLSQLLSQSEIESLLAVAPGAGSISSKLLSASSITSNLEGKTLLASLFSNLGWVISQTSVKYPIEVQIVSTAQLQSLLGGKTTLASFAINTPILQSTIIGRTLLSSLLESFSLVTGQTVQNNDLVFSVLTGGTELQAIISGKAPVSTEFLSFSLAITLRHTNKHIIFTGNIYLKEPYGVSMKEPLKTILKDSSMRVTLK